MSRVRAGLFLLHTTEDQTTKQKEMKYVMLTHIKTGLRVPVFGSEILSHCDLAKGHKDWLPTSAGNFDIASLQCGGHSQSLGLRWAKGDGEICQAVLFNMEAVLMLSQDLDENKETLKRLRPIMGQDLDSAKKAIRRTTTTPSHYGEEYTPRSRSDEEEDDAAADKLTS